MRCQIESMSAAVESLSALDRFRLWRIKRRRYLAETAKKVISDPLIIGRKLAAISGLRDPKQSGHFSGEKTGQVFKPAGPLGLKAGERVRIKSVEEIRQTLDDDGRYQGLGFMPAMKKYCGGVYTVRKRLDLFFDEHSWRMMKTRNVFILDEVFCELPAEADEVWGGCDRTCFLFWKEVWLERV